MTAQTAQCVAASAQKRGRYIEKSPPVGLENFANNCWMSSSFHGVNSCTPISDWLLCGRSIPAPPTEIRTQEEAKLAIVWEWDHLYQSMLRNPGGVEAPVRLAAAFFQAFPSFREGRQQDAHEAVLAIFDALDSICVQTADEADPVAVSAPSPLHGCNPHGLATSTFGGMLRSTTVCKTCSRKSSMEDIIMDLSLNLWPKEKSSGASTKVPSHCAVCSDVGSRLGSPQATINAAEDLDSVANEGSSGALTAGVVDIAAGVNYTYEGQGSGVGRHGCEAGHVSLECVSESDICSKSVQEINVNGAQNCLSCKRPRSSMESRVRAAEEAVDTTQEDESITVGNNGSVAGTVNARTQSLIDALHQFTAPEDVHLTCPHCGTFEASKVATLSKLPNVLMIHVKRAGAQDSKISESLTFPENLDMTNFLTREGDDVQTSRKRHCPGSGVHKQQIAMYELQSVIEHRGSGNLSGHYIAYARHTTMAGEKEWHQCNDKTVRKVTRAELHKVEPYLLFYGKKEAVAT